MLATHKALERHRRFLHAFQHAEENWSRQCDEYLPITTENSFWRQSREAWNIDPEQGWKIHISATILTAVSILEAVAPLLSQRGILFKAPRSLVEIKKINCGLFYGFSQIGKIIVAYPAHADLAVELANALHRLTAKFVGPSVPFDKQLHPQGCIFYRYGAFQSILTVKKRGKVMPAILTPSGDFVPDRRSPGAAVPEWLTDPFQSDMTSVLSNLGPSFLKTKYLAYGTISQRGKGGVYAALDISVSKARNCIIKEGRKYGETDLDGRDGFWRISHESKVLDDLRRKGLLVPKVYDFFSVDRNAYLVIERIRGLTLASVIDRYKGIIPVVTTIEWGLQMAAIIQKIHESGWIWRDCKPSNFIVSGRKRLRPIDFEGACSIDKPDYMPWGTNGYTPPTSPADHCSTFSEDLYALGACLYTLITKKPPDCSAPLILTREDVPPSLAELIHRLLSPTMSLRPSLIETTAVLNTLNGDYTCDFMAREVQMPH